MQPTRWTLGNTVAFVTPRAALLCPATIHLGIDSVMRQVEQAQCLEDLLNCSALTDTQGLDFGVVFWTATKAEVALRGEVKAMVHTSASKRDFSGGEDVARHEVDDVTYLRLQLPGAQLVPGMPALPVESAVVPAGMLEFGSPGLEPEAVTGAGKVTPAVVETAVAQDGQDFGEQVEVAVQDEPVPPAEVDSADAGQVPEVPTEDDAGEGEAELPPSPVEAELPVPVESALPAEVVVEEDSQRYGKLEMSDGRKMAIRSALVFGRMPNLSPESGYADAEMVIVRSPMALVSRTHCMISIADAVVQVVDLGSNNGTYLQREGLGSVELEPHQAVPLQKNDVIDLGEDVTITVTELRS